MRSLVIEDEPQIGAYLGRLLGQLRGIVDIVGFLDRVCQVACKVNRLAAKTAGSAAHLDRSSTPAMPGMHAPLHHVAAAIAIVGIVVGVVVIGVAVIIVVVGGVRVA
jgi:hypothetical protein